ncbi:cysteine desulfurase [bacterium]|nr:cysteine desulfurase [bacterium]
MSASHTKLSQHSPFAGAFLTAHRPTSDAIFGGLSLPSSFIYLDHAAATPLDSRILDKMLPWMTTIYGNPANRLHRMGELAEHGLAHARTQVADCLGVEFDEVIFCSSATEANNLFLRGITQNPLRKRNKILISSTEHSSILSTVRELQSRGIQLEILPVDAQGQISLKVAEAMIDESTLAVCVMDVNNETGVIQAKLPQIASLAHAKGAYLHVDAVQGCARGHLHTSVLPFDCATISGAKIYAGKGAAALIVRKRHPRIRLTTQMTGGGHEGGLRSGTPNLPAIAGLAEGLRLQYAERKERLHYLAHLESIFISTLRGQIGFEYAGDSTSKAPGILMLRLQSVNAMKLIENMHNICVSAGSACKTLQATTSHVLLAMGYEEDEALSSFRVSIGLPNSEAEMKSAAELIASSARTLRRESAAWGKPSS